MEYQQVSELNSRQVTQLSELYQSEWWTVGRSLSDVQTMVENSSLVFGVITPRQDLVGFVRVLTDKVYKALIFDMIVSSEHRKNGLGGLLMEWVLSHPNLREVKHFELYCLPELRPFYEKWGFAAEVGGIDLLRRVN